jgi:hypothetical protein
MRNGVRVRLLFGGVPGDGELRMEVHVVRVRRVEREVRDQVVVRLGQRVVEVGVRMHVHLRGVSMRKRLRGSECRRSGARQKQTIRQTGQSGAAAGCTPFSAHQSPEIRHPVCGSGVGGVGNFLLFFGAFFSQVSMTSIVENSEETCRKTWCAAAVRFSLG